MIQALELTFNSTRSSPKIKWNFKANYSRSKCHTIFYRVELEITKITTQIKKLKNF